MELPTYLRVIWAYKWLLLVGIVAAVAAGIFAGYTVGPAGLASRAVQSYTATTTLVVTSAKDPLYQAEVPAQKLRVGYTAPQTIDLSNSAVIYAYIISGSKLRETVAQQIGPLNPETESVTAVRRTTQPAGNERFPGNLRLPVIDVIATAVTTDRAKAIGAATTQAFLTYVKNEQDARHLSKDQRVRLEVTNVGDAVPVEVANPNAPVVFTAFGVLVAVLSLIFAIHGFRTSRTRRRAALARARAAASEQEREPASGWDWVDVESVAPDATAAASEQKGEPESKPLVIEGAAAEATVATSEEQQQRAGRWEWVGSKGAATDAAAAKEGEAAAKEGEEERQPAGRWDWVGINGATIEAPATASEQEGEPASEPVSADAEAAQGDEGSDDQNRFAAAQARSE
jgi:hypothetical protein